MSKQGSILTEADTIINGPRRDAYGSVERSFGKVAATWTGILGTEVTPQHVALCMIALKLHREANKSARDNRVDMVGYVALLDQICSEVSP